MSVIITTIGWLGLVVAVAYFVIYDGMVEPEDIDYIRNTRDIIFVSVTLIVGGYILKYTAPLFGFGYGKCKTCGKRIEKQEMFCFDHRIQAIRDAQDRTRG